LRDAFAPGIRRAGFPLLTDSGIDSMHDNHEVVYTQHDSRVPGFCREPVTASWQRAGTYRFQPGFWHGDTSPGVLPMGSAHVLRLDCAVTSIFYDEVTTWTAATNVSAYFSSVDVEESP
jgi:hypothetical protein